MYYLVFNTLVLLIAGYCLVGVIAYPYSSQHVSQNEKVSTNEKFGQEYMKSVERVVRVLQDMLESQGTGNTTALLLDYDARDGHQNAAEKREHIIEKLN